VVYAPPEKTGQGATLPIDVGALQEGIEADLEQFTVPGAGLRSIERH
jgi:hypothetical protein